MIQTLNQAQRHQGGANYAFADGHAQWLSAGMVSVVGNAMAAGSDTYKHWWWWLE